MLFKVFQFWHFLTKITCDQDSMMQTIVLKKKKDLKKERNKVTCSIHVSAGKQAGALSFSPQ